MMSAATAAGAGLGLAFTLSPGSASVGGAGVVALGDDLSFGFDFIPGCAVVPNNFHAAAIVRMPRVLRTVVAAAAAPFDIAVERERRTALTAEDLPRVLIYAMDSAIEAEFVGASSLRTQRIQVEVVDAVRDGDDFDAVQDRVAAMAARIRMAIEANPTLSGASLGVTVEDGGEPRAGDLARQEIEARTLICSAAYVT
jgi:hypothetical protein